MKLKEFSLKLSISTLQKSKLWTWETQKYH